MTHWFEVFRYELRQVFRRKAYLFMTFGIPLLAILAFYGYQVYKDQTSDTSEDTPATPVTEANEGDRTFGYVDLTPDSLFPAPESYPAENCTLAQDEIDAVVNNPAPTAVRSTAIKRISSPYCLKDLVLYYPTFEAGRAALEDGAIDLLAVIEPDYAETGDVSVYVETINIMALESQSLFEDFVLRSLLYDVAPEEYETLYLRLRDPAYVSTATLTTTGGVKTENEDQAFVVVYAFGIITMFGIFYGGGYLMQSVVQEKESRIVEIIMSSVQPSALLFGKIMANGLAALLQIVLVMGTFVFLATRAGDVISSLGDIDISAGSLVVLVVYFVLGFLLFGSLMAAIGAISTTVRESQNFVVVVTLPAAIPFFFLALFADQPNGTLPVVLSMFPLTAPLSMVMRMAVTDVPIAQLALSLALLLAGIAFAIWFAGRLFRVNILLSGTMPKFKDIPKLLRG